YSIQMTSLPRERVSVSSDVFSNGWMHSRLSVPTLSIRRHLLMRRDLSRQRVCPQWYRPGSARLERRAFGHGAPVPIWRIGSSSMVANSLRPQITFYKLEVTRDFAGVSNGSRLPTDGAVVCAHRTAPGHVIQAVIE